MVGRNSLKNLKIPSFDCHGATSLALVDRNGKGQPVQGFAFGLPTKDMFANVSLSERFRSILFQYLADVDQYFIGQNYLYSFVWTPLIRELRIAMSRQPHSAPRSDTPTKETPQILKLFAPNNRNTFSELAKANSCGFVSIQNLFNNFR